MDELDNYGSFNTRYEGAGSIKYSSDNSINVYFEVRQLIDGRLLIACISPGETIGDNPVAIEGYLLSGEPFSTMWGRGIKEIYRDNGNISKVYYIANMTRVRYTKDLQPDDHSVQYALHNLIPGRNSNIVKNKFEFYIQGFNLSIIPVGNHGQQAEHLLRHGGNLRTSWAKAQLTDTQGNRQIGKNEVESVVQDMLLPISLALGTLVTCPQVITLDAKGNRNDVEHYISTVAPFSQFICAQGWDAPIKETVEAWFSPTRPQFLSSDILTVTVKQHLDACSTELYLETRALIAATLLDVLAGRYLAIWNPQAKSHKVPFMDKLQRLLDDLAIEIDSNHLDTIKKARNSLVHSGRFVTSERDKIYSEYCNLLLLGRSILLRLMGFPSMLHDAIED
jgi:hypothetical protein